MYPVGRSPSVFFRSGDCEGIKGIEVHKRGAKTKTFAPTTKLFKNWRATKCPTKAYFLVQDFVAAVAKHVVYGMGVWKPVAKETKRIVGDAPGTSAAEAKRHKTGTADPEVITADADSDDCVIIERPKTPLPRCAGNRAPPLPPRHPYLASAWTAARRCQFACIISSPAGATAGTRCASANQRMPRPEPFGLRLISSIARPRVAGSFSGVLASAQLNHPERPVASRRVTVAGRHRSVH
jgi:hypothetical protein